MSAISSQFSIIDGMRRTWPVLLGLLLLAAPAAVQAQYDSPPWFYSRNATNINTITITSYTGAGGAVTIPTNINNLLVTGIGNGESSAFAYTGVTSVTIPGSVTTIGEYAFEHCNSLTNVTIPAGVTSIGDNVFLFCINLTAITVDADNSFYSSTNGVLFDKSQTTLLQYPEGLGGRYTIPGGVTSIEEEAFLYCTKLTSITIPGGVTTIGEYAFEHCNSLTNVTIPASVTSIGDNVFFFCINLTAITVDADNSFYSSTNGVLFDKSQTTLIEYPDGLHGSYTIPDGVTSIGDGAFESCTSLTSVTIPDSVTSIGDNVFLFCINLAAITVDADNSFYSSTNGVLFDESQSTLVEYPDGLHGSYTIPDGVTSIGDGAFESCTSLTSVMIPGSVTSIGVDAFASTSLTSVTIPNSVTNIGEGAFTSTTLTSVTIPGSATSIGEAAFQECGSLNSVTIANGVTSIGEVAFADCANLTNVTIPGSVTNIGEFAFDGCTSLANVMIANGVTSIGPVAFVGCTSLTSITIPGSVTNIGDGAFSGCTSLTSVCFTGNAPTVVSDSFSGDPVTFYYLAGASGWNNPPNLPNPVLWNPLILTGAGFGVQNNHFGFNITNTAKIAVVVEACTNLACPVWTPLQTVTLTNGSFHFSDPQWTNYSARFYGLGFP